MTILLRHVILPLRLLMTILLWHHAIHPSSIHPSVASLSSTDHGSESGNRTLGFDLIPSYHSHLERQS
jgi:hypothetical protein